MPENKQPGKYDAVIKRVPQAPMYGAVIGGIQGVKRRFESAQDVNLKAEILREALQYEAQGIEFILQVFERANQAEILAEGYKLLKDDNNPIIQKVGLLMRNKGDLTIEERLLKAKLKHPWLDLSKFSFETVKVNRKGEVIKREEKTARYYREDLGNGICLDMVYIQGGTFMMGSPDGKESCNEKPRLRRPPQRFPCYVSLREDFIALCTLSLLPFVLYFFLLFVIVSYENFMKELSVIQKTYDLIKWYVSIIEKLPKTHKLTLNK